MNHAGCPLKVSSVEPYGGEAEDGDAEEEGGYEWVPRCDGIYAGELRYRATYFRDVGQQVVKSGEDLPPRRVDLRRDLVFKLQDDGRKNKPVGDDEC